MEREQYLIERIRSGDRKAREELYLAYAPKAMAVAMRYMADEDAARDVLQEAFIKVLTRFETFEYRGEGSLKAWVMRVVVNEAMSLLRQRQRHATTAIGEYDDVADDSDLPDTEEVPIDVLQHMIEQLPEGYRVVFCLYVFERKSHKEIASMLDIKENSSASQFLRAKRMLARLINNYKRDRQ